MYMIQYYLKLYNYYIIFYNIMYYYITLYNIIIIEIIEIMNMKISTYTLLCDVLNQFKTYREIHLVSDVRALK